MHLSHVVACGLAAGLLLAPVTYADDEHGHGTLALVEQAVVITGSPEWDAPLNPVLAAAASTHDVPLPLLLTLGKMGSAFENRGSEPTVEGGYGAMALRENILGGDSLLRAAELVGSTPDELKVNPVLNIQGAAALLSYEADAQGVDRSGPIDGWWPVILRYAGLDAESSEIFAWQVFRALEQGWTLTNSRGETFTVAPQPIEMNLEAIAPPAVMILREDGTSTTPTEQSAIPLPLSPDYPPAVWNPAASCNYSTAVTNKDTIVVHTIEGSYAGAISWFKNCNSGVSSHYVIAEDGRITQMVRENQRAYHAGCYNSRSIGLEHEGFAASSSHPTSLYNASGDLARDICDAWGIPKQKRTVGPGIIGHRDVTNCCCGTHTDPGNGWNWTYYISRVGGAEPQPAYAASFHAQSYPSQMVAGSTAVVWVEFKNDGTSNWTHCATKLGTSGPRDRNSPFCTPSNWACASGSNPGCHRPTDVDQSSVSTGQIGRFTFILTAPTTPGTYTERFELVREGVTWFGPQITWTIQVVAGQGNLTGTVRKASDNAPISGATVTLNGVGSTTTNGSGVYTFNNVTAGNYTVSVSAVGFSPSSSSVAITTGQTTTKDFALSVTDTEPPTTPTNLVATATGSSSIKLDWTAATDNIGVASYEIRRNGAIVNTSASTTFTDSGLSPQTQYTYEVRARDAALNPSGWSNSASAVTLSAPVVVFSDGFNGNLNNWTQQTAAFAYSTAQNHGSLPGAGAAFVGASETDQMFKTFARPFAQARASGWFYDGKGGWKTGTCGWQYRQGFSLRETTGSAAFIIDNTFNSAVGSGDYFFRKLGGGSPTSVYTPYATRNPNTNCNGAWIFFETTITPGAVGASPTGNIMLKVTDGAGTTTTNTDLTTDFFNVGVGRITLGLGVSSANEGYWDDIVFEATPPNIPTMGTPNVTATQIQWTFVPADNNFFGYEVANASNTILSPQYPNDGWLNRSATSWTQTGLAPNTAYSAKVRAWNGTLNSVYSALTTVHTLSAPPGPTSISPSAPTGCPEQPITWTAVGGFGPGTVAYYRFVFDKNPTHTFDGTEAQWSSGTIMTEPDEPGTWYLHVQGYNAANVPNGTFSYALPVPDGDGDLVADCLDGCPADPLKTEPGVCGCGIADTDQVSIQEQGQPVDAVVSAGQTATFSVGASGENLTYQWYAASGPLADGGKISGATTDTLQIASVDETDAVAGPYYVIVSGDCGSPVTSHPADIIINDAPVITAWRSVRPHGASELAIELDAAATGNGSGGPTVEPRQGGLQRIEVDFDGPVVLDEEATVVVTGQTTTGGVLGEVVDYSAVASVSMADSDTLVVTFAPGAIPDATCLTISVAGLVRNTLGQAVAGDADCMVRTLVGDTGGDGLVNLGDALRIAAAVGQPVVARLDVDLNGSIELSDALAAKALVASPAAAALCP